LSNTDIENERDTFIVRAEARSQIGSLVELTTWMCAGVGAAALILAPNFDAIYGRMPQWSFVIALFALFAVFVLSGWAKVRGMRVLSSSSALGSLIEKEKVSELRPSDYFKPRLDSDLKQLRSSRNILWFIFFANLICVMVALLLLAFN